MSIAPFLDISGETLSNSNMRCRAYPIEVAGRLHVSPKGLQNAPLVIMETVRGDSSYDGGRPRNPVDQPLPRQTRHGLRRNQRAFRERA